MSVIGIGSSIASSIGSSQVYAIPSSPTTASVAEGSSNESPTPRTQVRSDFASMFAAIQAGDMTSAQQALTAVQSDLSSANATYSPQSQQSTAPVPTDLQALFSAVQQGDTTSAQQALEKLRSDMSQHAGSVHGHGHHHHHQAPPVDPTAADGSANDATGNSTSPTSTIFA